MLSAQQRPEAEAEGETTRGPTGGLFPPRFTFGGQIALTTPNHQRGGGGCGSRWLIAQNRVSCKRLTFREGDLVPEVWSFFLKVPPPSRVEGGERLSAAAEAGAHGPGWVTGGRAGGRAAICEQAPLTLLGR